MFSITPLSFDAFSPMNPSNIGTNLTLAETRVIGLHLCRWQYRSIFIQIFTVSSERRTCFETQRIMTLQGHPRSLILALIESPCMTSYSTSIVTLVLSCCVSEILEVLYAESHFFSTPPLFGRKFQGAPLGVDPRRLGCKERASQANWRWNYFRRFPTYVITIHQRYRRTDGRTDDMRSHATALCTKVHRAVKTIWWKCRRKFISCCTLSV